MGFPMQGWRAKGAFLMSRSGGGSFFCALSWGIELSTV